MDKIDIEKNLNDKLDSERNLTPPDYITQQK